MTNRVEPGNVNGFWRPSQLPLSKSRGTSDNNGNDTNDTENNIETVLIYSSLCFIILPTAARHGLRLYRQLHRGVDMLWFNGNMYQTYSGSAIYFKGVQSDQFAPLDPAIVSIYGIVTCCIICVHAGIAASTRDMFIWMSNSPPTLTAEFYSESANYYQPLSPSYPELGWSHFT